MRDMLINRKRYGPSEHRGGWMMRAVVPHLFSVVVSSYCQWRSRVAVSMGLEVAWGAGGLAVPMREGCTNTRDWSAKKRMET